LIAFFGRAPGHRSETIMAQYVWQHALNREPERLRLMSALLDPSSTFHLLRTGVTTGWQCLEIGAGNGSLSQWLAQRVGSTGHVTATDIRTDLMHGITGGNLEIRQFDVVHDEPPEAPYDLIVIRALLHHLPERRMVVSKVARWLKPGGWLFVQEPDFYPTWTVEPPSQKHFWEDFIQWAATHQIDYYVGRKIAAWLQAENLIDINSEGHAILYNGNSTFARWWQHGIGEVADKLRSEGGVSQQTLDEFFKLYRDPTYWTTTIAFTATTAQRPAFIASDRS
jgi:2-polyprenyl-3-methyl-5-hydroxy-6-metoxy-1,4-benzoquinol methylase